MTRRQGADLGQCRCAGHAPPPGGARFRRLLDAFFSPPPKRPSPKKRSTPRKKVTSPRTEDHHLGALFDACGPGTSPRVSPRVSPRPSLDGDDDEQALLLLFDAIPRLSTTTWRLRESSPRAVTGEVGPPPYQRRASTAVPLPGCRRWTTRARRMVDLTIQWAADLVGLHGRSSGFATPTRRRRGPRGSHGPRRARGPRA